jgi:hypothetical protein
VKTFLVFEPADGVGHLDAADRILFLREKFRWSALFFAPIWLLWHRLWLGFLGWLAAVVALAFVAYAIDLTSQAAAPLLWLPTLLVAFEGTELLRRKLLRSGYREIGVVLGRNLEEAERRFFANWTIRPELTARTRAGQGAAPVPAGMAAAANPVLGLFPESGARR